ncbi:MAG: n-acetylglutamate synthase [Spirochaetaceae bacterium]
MTGDTNTGAVGSGVIDYHHKYFRSVENSANGEVSGRTVFHYREAPSVAPPAVVWATYRGGSILWGTLTGTKAADGSLSFCYQHVNTEGELRTGCCESTPAVLESGLIELREAWRWTNGDESTGTSVVREFIPRREEVEGL